MRILNNKYYNIYMKKRYAKRKQEAMEFLGGVCAICGTTENLQFDHIDRKEKEFSIADCMLWSEERFWNEIKKCQLLCIYHHNEKTIRDLRKNNGKTTHGNWASYRYCKCDICKAFARKQNKIYKETGRYNSTVE